MQQLSITFHDSTSFRSFASGFASRPIPGLIHAGCQKTRTDSRTSPCGIDAALEQSLRFEFRNLGPDHLVDIFCQNRGDDHLGFLAYPKSFRENLCICHSLRSAQATLHTLPVSRSMASQWAPGACANVWRWSDEWNIMGLHVFDRFWWFLHLQVYEVLQRCRAAKVQSSAQIQISCYDKSWQILTFTSLPPFFLAMIQFSGVGSWCALVAALRKNYSHFFSFLFASPKATAGCSEWCVGGLLNPHIKLPKSTISFWSDSRWGHAWSLWSSLQGGVYSRPNHATLDPSGRATLLIKWLNGLLTCAKWTKMT